MVIFFASLFRSAFSEHSFPKLFINFWSFLEKDRCANERWSFIAISLLDLFLVVRSTMRSCSLLLFIYLLLFFGSCFAGVIGRLYKPLEVVFKGISLTIKLIVSFENLSSIAPLFMADFDRRRGVSMSTIWVLYLFC